jgi:hypothetical protein
MLRNQALKYAIIAVLGLNLNSAPLVAVIKDLPVDGSLKTLSPEKLESPYDKDEYYAYTKSPSFTRWIYSTWTSPTLDNETTSLVLSDIKSKAKRSVLIAEFNVDISHLDAQKDYQLLLANDYVCGGSDETVDGQPCILEFSIRCYGPGEGEDNQWGITFQEEKKITTEVGEGKFATEGISFPVAKCQSGLYIAAEANLSPTIDQYRFKGLKVGLQNVTTTPEG